jgi:hypothetical protein
MVVAFVDTEALMTWCVGMGIIEEYSPIGVLAGFLVPHSFFVIVRVKVVNTNYKNHAAHYEFPLVSILDHAVGHQIL